MPLLNLLLQPRTRPSMGAAAATNRMPLEQLRAELLAPTAGRAVISACSQPEDGHLGSSSASPCSLPLSSSSSHCQSVRVSS